MKTPFISLPDLIEESERVELEDYALGLHREGRLTANEKGVGRFYAAIHNTDLVTPTIQRLADRLESRFGIANCPVDPLLGWIISVQFEGAFVHPHVDEAVHYTDGTRNHFRCNVIVSKPESGGVPMIAMRPVPLIERGGWAFFASKSEHLSTPVAGQRPRITYQFGYATAADWLPREMQDAKAIG